MEVCSRVIAEAIETGAMLYGREDGRTLSDGSLIAAERRAVLGRDLRAWMIASFPNDKPSFLFDDIEQNPHTSISADAYRAVVVDRDALVKQIEATALANG
jgi:hypothetical protein